MRFFVAATALLGCFVNSVLSASNIKGVFAHYLVVGLGSQSEANNDVQQAKNAGFDAFALDLLQVAQYSNITLDFLFTAADNQGFKLFFSLDMGGGNLAENDYRSWLGKVNQYVNRPSYYRVNGRPFLSTFRGGTLRFGQSSVDAGWQYIFQQTGLTGNNKPYFVPNFDDASSYNTGSFWSNFPNLQGLFPWETAWTAPGSASTVTVSNNLDSSLNVQAHNAGKVYMMPWSSFQYKNIPNAGYYYRKGELTFASRVQQIIDTQPDYVELISWNDYGESHYIGVVHPEPLNAPGQGNVKVYTNGFDHTPWQAMLPNLIYGIKVGAPNVQSIYPSNGVTCVGNVWYRTVLKSACSNPPSGSNSGVDAINYAFLRPAGTSGESVKVYSNNALVGTYEAKAGLNLNSVPLLRAGAAPRVEVYNYQNTLVASYTGPQGVSGSDQSLCNWNYQVGRFTTTGN